MCRFRFLTPLFLIGALVSTAAGAANVMPPPRQQPVVALGCDGSFFLATNRGWVFSHPYSGARVLIKGDGTQQRTPESWGRLGKRATNELIARINVFYRKKQRIRKLHFTPDCRGWSIVSDASSFTRNVGGATGPLDRSYYDALKTVRVPAVAATAFDPYRYRAQNGFAIAFSRQIVRRDFADRNVYVRKFMRNLPRYQEFVQRVGQLVGNGDTIRDIAFVPRGNSVSGFTILTGRGTSFTRGVGDGRRTTGGNGAVGVVFSAETNASCRRDPNQSKCRPKSVSFNGTATTYSYFRTLQSVQAMDGVAPVSVSFAPTANAPAYDYALLASDLTLFASPVAFDGLAAPRPGMKRVGTTTDVLRIVSSLAPSL